MLNDVRSPLENEAVASSDGALPAEIGFASEDDSRNTRAMIQRRRLRGLPLRRTGKALSDVGRYLLVATAFLVTALVLAFMDERSEAPHLATASAVLMIGMAGASLIAIYKAKTSMEGAARPISPSMVDKVTELPNEEYLRLRLGDEFKRMQRHGSSLSVAVFDVNNLASVNEAYGDVAGDAVANHIAEILDRTKRASDVAARLENGEFGLILLDCNEEAALGFLGRLEHYVGRKPVSVNVEGQSITLWVGICSGVASNRRGSTSVDLLNRARRSLEAAKEDRDRRRAGWTRSA